MGSITSPVPIVWALPVPFIYAGPLGKKAQGGRRHQSHRSPELLKRVSPSARHAWRLPDPQPFSPWCREQGSLTATGRLNGIPRDELGAPPDTSAGVPRTNRLPTLTGRRARERLSRLWRPTSFCSHLAPS